MRNLLLFLLLMLCVGGGLNDANPLARIFTDNPFVDEKKFEEAVYRHEIVAVLGETATLPCDFADTKQTERPNLILWYKGSTKLPVYSLDLRSSSAGQHWKDNSTIGPLSHVTYKEWEAGTSFQWGSTLHINPVYSAHSGVYRCRVDFESLPTHNAWIKIKVITPPDKPRIENQHGNMLNSFSDAVLSGSSYQLTCSSRGDPTPSISWSLDHRPLPPATVRVNDGRAESTLVLDKVDLKDRNKVVECQASNNNLTPTLRSSVRLNVISPPSGVNIRKEVSSFMADTEYILTCDVQGSIPSPQVKIRNGGTALPTLETRYDEGAALLTLTAQFTPTIQDNGRFLSCAAVNRHVPLLAVEDQWKIDVNYGPEAVLSIRSNNTTTTNSPRKEISRGREDISKGREDNSRQREGNSRGRKADGIRLVEGDSLVLDCVVSSNPSVQTIHWFRQDRDLENELESNVKIRGLVLTISNILSSQSGLYACQVSNGINTAQSNTVNVSVKGLRVSGLRECLSYNHTISAFSVACTTNNNNINSPSYTYQVYDSETRKLLTNVITSSSNVTFGGLPASRDMVVEVYLEGDDVPFILDAFTLRTNENQLAASTVMSNQTSSRMIQLVGLLSGVLVVLVTLTIIFIILRRKASARLNQREYIRSQLIDSNTPTTIYKGDSFPNSLAIYSGNVERENSYGALDRGLSSSNTFDRGYSNQQEMEYSVSQDGTYRRGQEVNFPGGQEATYSGGQEATYSGGQEATYSGGQEAIYSRQDRSCAGSQEGNYSDTTSDATGYMDLSQDNPGSGESPGVGLNPGNLQTACNRHQVHQNTLPRSRGSRPELFAQIHRHVRFKTDEDEHNQSLVLSATQEVESSL